MTTFTAWLMIVMGGTAPIVVPYPYSSIESCRAAIAEGLPGATEGQNVVCLPIEVTK